MAHVSPIVVDGCTRLISTGGIHCRIVIECAGVDSRTHRTLRIDGAATHSRSIADKCTTIYGDIRSGRRVIAAEAATTIAASLLAIVGNQAIQYIACGIYLHTATRSIGVAIAHNRIPQRYIGVQSNTTAVIIIGTQRSAMFQYHAIHSDRLYHRFCRSHTSHLVATVDDGLIYEIPCFAARFHGTVCQLCFRSCKTSIDAHRVFQVDAFLYVVCAGLDPHIFHAVSVASGKVDGFLNISHRGSPTRSVAVAARCHINNCCFLCLHAHCR